MTQSLVCLEFTANAGNLVVLCMGAVSGSIGALAVFPINLLVCPQDVLILANKVASSRDCNAAV
jgi:hypothetical protein